MSFNLFCVSSLYILLVVLNEIPYNVLYSALLNVFKRFLFCYVLLFIFS